MLNFRLVYIFAALMAFCIFNTAHAETLQDAVHAALANHPSIDVANEGFLAAREERDIESSHYFPELSATAAGGRVYQDNATSRGLSVTRGAAYSYYGEGTFALNQMIFDGMETPSRVDAARARMRSSKVNIADTQDRVAMRAVQAYIELLRAYEGVEMIQAQADKIKDYQTRIKSMVDQGAADETEYQQARDVNMIIEALKVDYEGQALAAAARYQEATGHMPEGEFSKPTLMEALLPETAAQATEIAKKNHPSLSAARLEAEAAQKEINAARAQFFPDLSGELSYLKNDKKDLIGGESEDKRALLRMNWNFSTGGKEFSNVDRTQYKHKQALAHVSELERGIERDIHQAYAEYDTSRRQLELSNDRIALNEKLFETYKAQFEGSRITLLSLMRAESQLFTAGLEKMDNGYRYMLAQYAILANLGQLTKTLDPNTTAATAKITREEDPALVTAKEIAPKNAPPAPSKVGINYIKPSRPATSRDEITVEILPETKVATAQVAPMPVTAVPQPQAIEAQVTKAQVAETPVMEPPILEETMAPAPEPALFVPSSDSPTSKTGIEYFRPSRPAKPHDAKTPGQ